MKKFLVLILAFFAFCVNGHANFDDVDGLKIDVYTVSVTTGSVAGKDTYITEIYYWDTTTASYKLEDRYNAHIKLEVPVKVIARGKGYFSVWSAGDLHKYSSAYHPPDESPAHVSALNGDSDTGVKVGSGWPIIIFKGMKSKTVTAEGTLVTDTSNKYELKGKGKLDTSKGGGSGSAGGVGAGTGGVSSSGGWTNKATSFRVSVLDVRPSRPDDPPADNPPADDPPPSENPVVDPPPTPTPPPSPTYHACGDHETSVSGDHSLQASCSSTDSNGNYCTVTNFYACASHTHSYPAPPPPPTTVACGGASYTGCSGASSRTAHHVPSCSHCGNGYWTCGQYAYRHTTQNTCQRSGCGVTYYECQNGTCTSDSGTNPYHYAQ